MKWKRLFTVFAAGLVATSLLLAAGWLAWRVPGRFFPGRTGLPSVLTNSIGQVLIKLSPAQFTVGSTEKQKRWALAASGREHWIRNEGQVTPVELTYPFHIGQTEVTVAQYRMFVEETGYRSDAHRGICPLTWTGHEQLWQSIPGRTWEDTGWPQADDHPVVCLTWNDARRFCEWLTGREQQLKRIGTNQHYRLPTEAEWEYACRGTQTTHFAWGDDPMEARSYANVLDSTPHPDGSAWKSGQVFPWQDGYTFTAPVAHFAPNAFNLYDMHGNAWEWCENKFYRHLGEKLVNPISGAPWGKHILHGGSWDNSAGSFRCATRRTARKDFASDTTGFRVVLVNQFPAPPD